MLVLGAKEVEVGTVSVRHRDHENLATMTFDEFTAQITAEIRERRL
jgi:threonyl-tRNA synthetase